MKKSDSKPKVDQVRPHTYDGIQEYDNRMPNWWLWTFYGAIIFSVLYWFSRYDTNFMTSDQERIEKEMAIVEEKRLASIGDLNDETLWQMANNPGFVASGETIYREKCLACHGPNLEGGIGLSLVDKQWRWGNTPESIYRVVADGSPNKSAGMQAWIGNLGPQKVSQVVAYVLSHHNPEELANAESENEPLRL